MQSIHSDFKKENHGLDIVVLCDSLASPANIGGTLRLADAFGVKKVVFLEGVSELTSRAKSVSRGTQRYLNFEFCTEFEFDDRDWFCLELTKLSKPINNFKVSSNKIGVIVGNENFGVRQGFLKRFPSFHIKMFGYNSSMNVSSALSVALFQLTNS